MSPDDLELPEGSAAEEDSSGEEASVVSLREALSALLFVAPRPLSAAALSEFCNADAEEVDALVRDLSSELKKLSLGYELVEIAGAWQFRTSVSCRDVVTRLIPLRARKLSKAAAETLAVVAYKQPVPRSEIEAIRGVDALPTLKTLLDAKLVRIIGREDSPGQPALYGTTAIFLEKFGLRDLAELPTVREIVELAEEPGESAVMPEQEELDFSAVQAAEDSSEINHHDA